MADAEREEVAVEDAVSVAGEDPSKESTTGQSISIAPTEKPPEKEQQVKKPQSYDSVPVLNSYEIKPMLTDRFKAAPVKEIIRIVQAEVLTGKNYSSEQAKKWTIKIANEVNSRCRNLKMNRYKHIAQVTLGELKGAGVKSGLRCVWDCETDGYTSDIFMNDTIFCVTVVFALYLY